MSASTSTSARPAFWKPGTSRPGSSLDRSSETETPIIAPSSFTDSTLPIHSQRLQILHALETHQVLIIIAEPGSGKTTAIPRILDNASWSSSGIIACTQPRRISAISVASHVSYLMGSPLGGEVGYSIRFESNTTPATRICYMTDGTLFRECMRDPLLTRYSVIMVDEAHERGMYTDLLLGVLKKVLRKRRDLRIIVSSATLDAMVFKDFFNDSHTLSNYASHGEKEKEEDVARVIQIKGRTHPVHIAYLKSPCADYLAETVETIWKIHLTEPQGDILAFLTGREEINTALQMLSDRQASLPASAATMQLLPLHAGLSTAEQASIFSPSEKGCRKVVVATNIAEASVTLDGIVYVIDCGFVKQRFTQFGTTSAGVDTLAIVAVSRASAIQRAGRAGRTRPGKCFRLYTESFFLGEMQNSTSPELNRIGLEGVVLMLKSLGVDNLVRFEWVPPAPSPLSLARALQRLVELDALDDHARLTILGQFMAEIPLPPRLARILIASAEEESGRNGKGGGCAEEILTILSMLQVSHPFFGVDSVETQLSLRQFVAQEGDLFTLLNLFLAFVDQAKGKKSAKWSRQNRVNFQALSRALSIRNQLQRYLFRFASSSSVKLNPKSSAKATQDAVERITRTLAKGLYPNLARYQQDTMTFRTAVDGKVVYAHPNSVFFNRRPHNAQMWVIYGQAVEQSSAEPQQERQTKTYIMDITVLGDLEWVTDAVPGFYDVKMRYGRGKDGGGAENVIHTIAG
ncbi:related to PRP43 - spliceosomal RNA helicase (DEAH-box family) [Ustilago trichophora]|uniref:RNA helicase n=1 Tax=Ustilago trichophora TaxID=86804 RepID=A0A5C3EBV0_9BASI|nr:related to PRP43 - spliceosomal RNA helicase (DEAH-box family) [Ustilago trichophora]